MEDTSKTDGEGLTYGVAAVMRMSAKLAISCIVISERGFKINCIDEGR